MNSRSTNAYLRIFSAVDFCTREKILEKAGDPFWRNRFPGCGTVVGGASVPNHSAWGQVLVFSLKKSPFFEIFRLPLLRGVLLPKLGFRSKRGLFLSRSEEVDFSRPGEISGRETLFWAAQDHGLSN